jgi:hypothetical protein
MALLLGRPGSTFPTIHPETAIRPLEDNPDQNGDQGLVGLRRLSKAVLQAAANFAFGLFVAGVGRFANQGIADELHT